jgi:hypothetical protein
MKYRGFKITKTGDVYRVTTPSGEKWAEVAINRATAKRWVDVYINEVRSIERRKTK